MAKILVEKCQRLNLYEILRDERISSKDVYKYIKGLVWNFGFYDHDERYHQQEITFSASETNFGGHRVYFRCECERKVLNLYLPLGGTKFLCKECYGLIYKSQAKKGNLMYEAYYKYLDDLKKVERKLERPRIHLKTKLKLQREYDSLAQDIGFKAELLRKVLSSMNIVDMVKNIIN